MISVSVPETPNHLDAAIEFLQKCRALQEPAVLEGFYSDKLAELYETVNTPEEPSVTPQVEQEPDVPVQPDVEPPTGQELDINGDFWDERIHSSSKNKNADGSWRKRKGVDPAEFDKILNENRGATTAVVPPPPTTAVPPPAATTAVVPPPPTTAVVPPPTTTLYTSEDVEEFDLTSFLSTVITPAIMSGKLQHSDICFIYKDELGYSNLNSFENEATMDQKCYFSNKVRELINAAG